MKKILFFLKKMKGLVERFELKIELSNRKNFLLNQSLTSCQSIVSSVDDGKNLIVSLTTYNKRIHDVHLVIESIGQQTLKPSRVILWLDEDEFALDSIPFILKKQIRRGLEVNFCPNYRSYKKLIPTLQNHPEANIITIDDDVLYPHDMVELLFKEHLQFPDCIIGHRAHKMTFNSNRCLLPYNKWKDEILDSEPSDEVVVIGVGGVFYPSNSLSDECLNIDSFTQLAPNADDIWFKVMALLNGKKHKKVDDNRFLWSRFLLLEESQDLALYNDNKSFDGNDYQIQALFKKYCIHDLLSKR